VVKLSGTVIANEEYVQNWKFRRRKKLL